MKKKIAGILIAGALAGMLLTGCGSTASTDAADSTSAVQTETAADDAVSAETEAADTATECDLEDGTYTAVFNTDSSMFHVNEACEDKGTLTVENGQMTIHISLVSENIVNIYMGSAEEAPDHETDWLQPTTDTVTYDDGMSEEVYGFDVPVPAVDTDFQLSILGTKGTWYDHTVSVTDVQPAE